MLFDDGEGNREPQPHSFLDADLFGRKIGVEYFGQIFFRYPYTLILNGNFYVITTFWRNTRCAIGGFNAYIFNRNFIDSRRIAFIATGMSISRRFADDT